MLNFKRIFPKRSIRNNLGRTTNLVSVSTRTQLITASYTCSSYCRLQEAGQQFTSSSPLCLCLIILIERSRIVMRGCETSPHHRHHKFSSPHWPHSHWPTTTSLTHNHLIASQSPHCVTISSLTHNPLIASWHTVCRVQYYCMYSTLYSTSLN